MSHALYDPGKRPSLVDGKNTVGTSDETGGFQPLQTGSAETRDDGLHLSERADTEWVRIEYSHGMTRSDAAGNGI